jgi:hypothetical protein
MTRLILALLHRWEAWMDRRIDYASRCGQCCPCCDVLPADEEWER